MLHASLHFLLVSVGVIVLVCCKNVESAVIAFIKYVSSHPPSFISTVHHQRPVRLTATFRDQPLQQPCSKCNNVSTYTQRTKGGKRGGAGLSISKYFSRVR